MTPHERIAVGQQIQQAGCGIASCGCLMTLGGFGILLLLALAAGV